MHENYFTKYVSNLVNNLVAECFQEILNQIFHIYKFRENEITVVQKKTLSHELSQSYHKFTVVFKNIQISKTNNFKRSKFQPCKRIYKNIQLLIYNKELSKIYLNFDLNL